MTHKQRVLALLADGKPHSHHELYALHVIGHSRISDLRRDGYEIDQWRDGDDYMYRLVSAPQERIAKALAAGSGERDETILSGDAPSRSPDPEQLALSVPRPQELWG